MCGVEACVGTRACFFSFSNLGYGVLYSVDFCLWLDGVGGKSSELDHFRVLVFLSVRFPSVSIGEYGRLHVVWLVYHYLGDDLDEDVVHAYFFVDTNEWVVFLVRRSCPFGFHFYLVVSDLYAFFASARVAEICFDGSVPALVVIANVCLGAIGEATCPGE